MHYIADLHVHSPYAQATSKYLSLTQLYLWAQIKGIDLLGSGDFTHPTWLETLQQELIPAGNGFYQLRKSPTTEAIPGIRPANRSVHFCLSSEVSTIYTYKGRVRKSHHLLYVPDFETAKTLNQQLARFGSLVADGRPILNVSARDLLEIVCSTSLRCYLIPAHIWTPWFSILGSKAGYDAVQDAFRDLTEHIFALETGLSSDPAMNWRLSQLDRYALVSNSDAHSASKLGREATRFDTEFSYDGLFQALKTKKGFQGTLEYFPEEGKYHLDGHRACHCRLYPEETKAYRSICPKCNKKLTVGVLHRVQDLADRSLPKQPAEAPNFDYIVPLPEILAQILGQRVQTKRVNRLFVKIINQFGNEFTFLRHTPIEEIAKHLPSVYAAAIRRLRTKEVRREPGYDGVYGQILLTQPTEQQLKIF